MKSAKWLLEILEQETFLKYHAYYKGVRHNHKAQGIIAFARLSNSKELTEKYVKVVQSSVEVYNENDPLTEQVEIDHLQSDNIEDYRGKNQGYYKLLSHYMNLHQNKYNGNIMDTIKGTCPPIVDGPLYSAFHGFIQMGYGLVVGSDQAVVEGITIIDQQYSPLYGNDMNNPKRLDLSQFGYGKTSLEDTLKVLQDEKLVQQVQEENKKDRDFRKETHMFGIYGWASPRYHSDLMMDLTNNLQLPEWFKPADRDISQIGRCMNWLMDIATKTYVEANRTNDFFLLHGVTSTWSARQVLPLLNYDDALLGLRGMVSGILMTYLEQGAPLLGKKPSDFYDGSDVTQDHWDALLKDVTNVDQVVYEQHVYKLVQCLYERWQENPSREFAKHQYAGALHITKQSYFQAGLSNIHVN